MKKIAEILSEFAGEHKCICWLAIRQLDRMFDNEVDGDSDSKDDLFHVFLKENMTETQYAELFEALQTDKENIPESFTEAVRKELQDYKPSLGETLLYLKKNQLLLARIEETVFSDDMLPYGSTAPYWLLFGALSVITDDEGVLRMLSRALLNANWWFSMVAARLEGNTDDVSCDIREYLTEAIRELRTLTAHNGGLEK